MTALIRADRDSVSVFLDGGADNFPHRPVVTQVYDLYPGRLKNTPHDVDGHVMPVEQARGSNETKRNRLRDVADVLSLLGGL